MEYMIIAYVLIAVILTGYGISLWRRTLAARRERQVLESKEQ